MKRGLITVAIAHLAGAAIAALARDSQLAGSSFLFFLLIVPILTIAGALLLRASGSLPRRAIQGGIIFATLPLITILSVQFGWWVVPIVCALLPIIGRSYPRSATTASLNSARDGNVGHGEAEHAE